MIRYLKFSIKDLIDIDYDEDEYRLAFIRSLSLTPSGILY